MIDHFSLVSNQLIIIGEELWSDIQSVILFLLQLKFGCFCRSTNVPHQRFNLFQRLQYYLKVVVFLLPKFQQELERDGIISRIIHEMLNDGLSFN